MSEQPAEEDFATELRRMAAHFAHIAEQCAEDAARAAELFERHGELLRQRNRMPQRDYVAGFRAMAGRARLLSQLNAAQALAYEHMLAAGGPDDPDAYADYSAATRFHISLIPTQEL